MLRLIARRTAAVRSGGDAGIGMLLVIGMTAVAMIVIVTVTAIGINSLKSSGQHVSFEKALAASESGIDRELSLLQSNFDQEPSVDYTTPSPCNVQASQVPATFASANAERDWAKTQILSFPSSCTTTTAAGQFVSFRPPGKQVVYSMGWSPSRTATGAKTRLLKAEYLFGPAKPADAILTQGDLHFSGSVTVGISDPATASNIHSNSAVSANGSSSLTVAGAISASGSNSLAGTNGACPSGVIGPCTGSASPERVNMPNPRQFYQADAETAPNGWYDLCPDGKMHLPPAVGSPAVPCTGSALNISNGWVYAAPTSSAPPTWTLVRQSGTTTYPGTYYVYHGDANVGDQGNDSTTWNITVMAESGTPGQAVPSTQPAVPSTWTNPSDCNKYGGNINWRLFTISASLAGTVFVADANLTGTANSAAGDGMFIAEDTVNMQSSSGSMTGAVVANNQCAAAGTNNVQGYTITYDKDAQVPVSSIIDTTLWLEYVG